MISNLIRLLSTSFAMSFVVGTFAAEPAVSLDLITDSAIAGIPVVVAIHYKNESTRDQRIYDPIDYWVTYVLWTWSNDQGARYEVGLADMNYSAIPQPARPFEYALKSGDTRSWRVVVPTPTSFDSEKTWQLSVRIAVLDKPDKFLRASVSVACDGDANAQITKSLGGTWAQAAVLEYPREDVLQSLHKDRKWSVVERHAASRDELAMLMMFSDALRTRDNVIKWWDKLDATRPQIRCLRNYLMLSVLRDQRQRPPVLSKADAEQWLKKLDAQDFFAEDLEKGIRRFYR